MTQSIVVDPAADLPTSRPGRAEARRAGGVGKETTPWCQPFNCWILSLNRVVAIDALCGWPLSQASANFFAWS